MGSGWIRRSAAEIWGLPSGQAHFINFYMALHGAVVEILMFCILTHHSMLWYAACVSVDTAGMLAYWKCFLFPLMLLEAILKYVLPDKIKWNMWIPNPKIYCRLQWEKLNRLQTLRRLFECSVRNATWERGILASLERARDQLRPFALALHSSAKIIHGNFIFWLVSKLRSNNRSY